MATLAVDKQLSAANSVLYDAVLAADGQELVADGYAVQFVREAFKHCKAVGVLPGAEPLLEAANLPGRQGVVDASAGTRSRSSSPTRSPRTATGTATSPPSPPDTDSFRTRPHGAGACGAAWRDGRTCSTLSLE